MWQSNTNMSSVVGKLLCGIFVALLASACSTFEYHETKSVKIARVDEAQEQLIDESTLLDVGIVLFHPGEVDLDADDLAYSSVRQSESVWFTSQLKETLEQSNAWGIVRALPKRTLPMDVIVTGKLIESNGEFVKIKVKAEDSSGRVWLDQAFEQQASSYAYHPEIDLPGDPFQATFSEIANALFNYQASLSADELRQIRTITKVLFARDFVPDAFSEYLAETDDGRISLLRVPANSDPMMQRVERVRARNDLFVDVIQDYYRTFNRQMEGPYQEWRKLSYKQVLYARQLDAQARKQKAASVLAIAGGVLAAVEGDRGTTRFAGHMGIFAGANLFRLSLLKSDEALSHSDALRELGESLESQLAPSIVDLQDRSVTLTGTVEDQFGEWRRILGEMFILEEGALSETVNDASGVNQEDD
ncbi:hypothetical protein DFR28_101624 [Arenicella xantha]|uniref:Lipoprotein n=2 Tax=Arenicella xantha TaxID=644221 RepID=A0A395JUM1_9GAMM|nr:hypothetical protein DFR28_101624 [Arenicella xantha]